MTTICIPAGKARSNTKCALHHSNALLQSTTVRRRTQLKNITLTTGEQCYDEERNSNQRNRCSVWMYKPTGNIFTATTSRAGVRYGHYQMQITGRDIKLFKASSSYGMYECWWCRCWCNWFCHRCIRWCNNAKYRHLILCCIWRSCCCCLIFVYNQTSTHASAAPLPQYTNTTWRRPQEQNL